MQDLPKNVRAYKRSATFNQDTVPAALLGEHTTKAGTWARIVVEEGALDFTHSGMTVRLGPSRPGIVIPEVQHKVSPIGEVSFFVEFYRALDEEQTSFDKAGGPEGLRKLVEAFYREMETADYAQRIHKMHPDMQVAREKLYYFLRGWLGGPREYAKKFGDIRLPKAHAHLDVGEDGRDSWLRCMQVAVDQQDWTPAFKDYFMGAIAVPAERIRVVAARHAAR